jgi:predicted small secreted protein
VTKKRAPTRGDRVVGWIVVLIFAALVLAVCSYTMSGRGQYDQCRRNGGSAIDCADLLNR